MITFAQRLKELRHERAITMRELSKILGVSEATISYWENNKSEPTLEKVLTIAKYFKVSIDYLVGLEDY